MEIRLKDGSMLALADSASARQAAEQISGKLAKAALAARINGETADLDTVLTDGCTLEILTAEDPEGLRALRHTASHVLAEAVKRLYPQAKLAIGPAIDDGFYYDFDVEGGFSNDDLAKIEKEMSRIVAENKPMVRKNVSRQEAVDLMRSRGEDYKLELIQDLPEDAEISLYYQGEFVDLCAGPHAPSTGKVKAFKLTSLAGAYWRGNEKNKMLSRIYGTAFEKKALLDEHLARIEEAKKRDHNKLGRELEYFTTVDVIGQGLPLLLPKGAKVIQVLQRFVEDEEARRGYVLTKTPYMAKRELYQISGHWDHYTDGMFVLGDKDDPNAEVLALRPMTCPFQYYVYMNRMRSYRDLPMRMGETSTLFRNEDSGEMHGLIRVRQFTISEGHLICTPEQLEEEFKGCVELAKFMMDTLGFSEDVSYRFSQWDPNDREKYIGTPEQWDEAQSMMGRILDHIGIKYSIGVGEAAFYGPKLDIQMKNVHGKEDTIITIQIDQMLAEQFGMEYVDRDGKKKRPYIIHRTSLGCYERTLALLIEKYAGALPLWMAPEQVRIMSVAESANEYAKAQAAKLESLGLRVSVDDRNEKIGYKIREARGERIPYMLVVGEKEAQEGTFAVRKRGAGEIGSMAVEEFTKVVLEEVAQKVIF